MSKIERPQRPSADNTRKKILRAAQHLFLARGYSAVATRKIAESAQVSENLIFHHFGDKANLWKAVKSHVVAESDIDFTIPETAAQDLNAFIKFIIYKRYEIQAKHPELPRLLAWQYLEGDMSLLGGHSFSPDNWFKYFESFKKKGLMRTDVSSITATLLLVGACEHFEYAKQLHVLSIEAYLEQIVTSLSQGLSQVASP